MVKIKTAVIFIFLMICGIWDGKKKEIPVWLCLMGAISMTGIQIYINEMTIWEMAGGISVGVILLAAAMLTKQIGLGDGIVFMITGMGLGFWNNFLLLWESLILLLGFSLLLTVFRKINMKSKLPFLPFVFGAYFIELGMNMGR